MSDRTLRAVVAALAGIGAAVAGYLLWARLTDTTIACATRGCETVQSSSYSELFGLPVAGLGLVAYAGILASALTTREWARGLGAAIALAGFGFSAYLVYVQAEVLGAFCNWCLASDIVMTVLAGAALLRIARPVR